MCKNTFLLFLCIFTCFSCKKDKNTNINEGYLITLNAKLPDNTKVYLQRFNNQLIQTIDSTTFLNESISFNGKVTSPERYLITINEVFGGLVLVVENDSILINMRNDDLINARISGSQLNNEMQSYKETLDKIYSKVDALFPEMQRARLSNNAEKLKQISLKMQAVETESIEYSFNYTSEKLDSYISAIILNDLSQRDSIDLKRITALYKKMPKDIQKSPDAKELSAFLESYK